MLAFSRLRRRFSNKPNVIQTRQGTEGLPFQSFHPHWIVGRGLSMYRSEDFTNVPRNRRRAALDLKLPLWSPFARTGHHCVWEGGRAMVWFWDADALAESGPDGPTGADGAPDANPDGNPDAAPAKNAPRIRPETVFLPRGDDGVLLQPCREGFELQHWRERVLEHSYWFRQRPDQGRIESVLAQWGAEAPGPVQPEPGGQTSDGQPIRQDSVFEPWSSAPAPGEWLEDNERTLVTAAVLILVLTATWHETRYWKARYLEHAAAAEFAALQQELDPVLSARNALLSVRGRNVALAEILGEPSQAYLMGLVDQAIPSPEASFRQWSYQQRELTVVVEDENADPIAYVRSFEAQPMFEQVAAEQGRNENEIRMTLVVRP